jgi:CubicO group peptidase (beta-lactamase class C family)
MFNALMRSSVTFALLTCLTTLAHAVSLHPITAKGTPVPTGVAGSKSTQVTNRAPGSDAFLWGLTYDEKGDKPCLLIAHWWRYTSKAREDFDTRFDICNGDADGDKATIFRAEDVLLPAVDSVTVCQAAKNNPRLKGATLTAAAVDKDGSVRVESGLMSRTFKRTSCGDEWSKQQACGSGQVAVGLDIHHNADEITGLALQCLTPTIGDSLTVPPPLTGDQRYETFEKDIRVQIDENGRTQSLTINGAIGRHEVNAVSIVIINGGKIERVRHYGVKSRKSEDPVGNNTLYQTASMSKLPAAIAMLAAARTSHGPKLNRTANQTTRKFPDSLVADWVDKEFKGDVESGFPEDITVQRLISHTAGLDTHGIGTAKSDRPTSLKTILLGGVGNPGVRPQSAPGTEWDYSGGSFSVAEAMLETQSGQSATTFLTNNILTPFGMTKSTYRDAADEMPRLARGCSRGLCSDNPEHTEAKFAGGLLATPEDYARLLQILLFDGRNPNDASSQLIPVEDVKRIFTPISHRDSSRKECSVHTDCRSSERCYSGNCIRPLDAWGDWYGLGVFLSPDNDHEGLPRYVEHGGDQTNAHTQFKLDRKERDGVVIFVAGDSSWTKDKVTYGASPLLTDIVSAYDRAY